MNHRSTLDLTNKKYGRLTVLYRAKRVREGTYTWYCRCDCGSEIEVRSDSLRSGNTKSCGCLSKEQPNSKKRMDLIGQRYGRLVVISLSMRRGNAKERYWSCRCDCGTTKDVSGAALRKGGTKSCGCFNREQVSKRMKTHGQSRTPCYWNTANLKRRELKRSVDCGWTLDMEKAIKQFQPACVVCYSKYILAVDHVYPLSLGYGLFPGNAVILCKRCNSRKNNRLLKDLPEDVRVKIETASSEFYKYWNNTIYPQTKDHR